MPKITLPDDRVLEIPEGATGLDVAKMVGKRLAKDALAIEFEGKVQSLTLPIEGDGKVRILTFEDEGGRDALRHSAAHIFAQALKRLYPKAKITIGPSIENGFYYDVADLKVSEDDLRKIESEMRKIVDADYKIERVDWSLDDVKAHFPDNPFKLELAKELAEKGCKLTAYKQGDFIDLCEGPHVPSTGYVKSFALTKIAAAHWRGDVKREALTRIYGTAFPSEKQLKQWQKLQEDLEKRDHRKLGRKLDLFTFSDLVGSGLPLFTPKGTTLRDELVKFSEELQIRGGFRKVWIPHITKIELYKKSGHWDKFGEELFLVKSQETSDEFALKPMNCPHHAQIYASRPRSYRDLPIRYMETTTCYRDEKSGELSGLSRVRSLTQDDGHVFCTMDQIRGEFENIMRMIKDLYSTLGMSFTARLSFWDPKNKKAYLGDANQWERAQDIIKSVAHELDLDHFVAEGEAAFYGPKIDIMVRDAFGRHWQCATQQLDFAQPSRFDLKYTDSDGKEKTPVMIHKALLGSIERFLSVFIEQTGGRFPLWCAPEQARVVPVSEKFVEGALGLVDVLRKGGIRAEIDDSSESVSKRVRKAQIDQVNYILVFGEKELEGDLQVRTREGEVFGPVSVEDFKQRLLREIKERK
ncbi:threonine--tRNA ligase [Candidatus Woesearchaeota archaeon]|nr:MAG: threonine--tRNA ligase [Candidatus Woesearchaeota archaeon]